MLLKHKDHDVVAIEDVVEESRKLLQTKLQGLQSKESELHKAAQQVDSIYQQLQTRLKKEVDELKTEIDQPLKRIENACLLFQKVINEKKDPVMILDMKKRLVEQSDQLISLYPVNIDSEAAICKILSFKNALRLTDNWNKTVYSQIIPYTLSMSSSYHGPQNTYAALTDSSNVNSGAATLCQSQECMKATFPKPVTISYVILGMSSSLPPGGWNLAYLNGSWLQYSTNGLNWVNSLKVEGIEDKMTKVFYLSHSICAQYWRLYRDTVNYVAATLFILN